MDSLLPITLSFSLIPKYVSISLLIFFSYPNSKNMVIKIREK